MNETALVGLVGVLAGFIGGTFGRYVVDIWVDRTRRTRDRQQLARMLLSEIRSTKGLVLIQVIFLQSYLQKDAAEQKRMPVSLRSLLPPPTTVYSTNIDRLGLLMPLALGRTIFAYNLLIHLGRLNKVTMDLAADQPTDTGYLVIYLDNLMKWLQLADKADEGLSLDAGMIAQRVRDDLSGVDDVL